MKKITILLSLIVSVNSQSLQFDGVDDYIDLGIISTIDFTKDFSIQVWIKTTSENDQGVLVKSNNDNTLDKADKSLFLDNGGFPWFGVGSVETGGTEEEYINSNIYDTTRFKVNDGKWHQIIVTYDKSTDIGKIWVDGVEPPQNGSYKFPTPDNPEDKIYIGKPTYNQQYKGFQLSPSSPSNTPIYFEGSIKNVALWPWVITDFQISKHWNDGKGMSASDEATWFDGYGAERYWKINDSYGSSNVKEFTDRGDAGKIYGATWLNGESSFNDKGMKVISFDVTLLKHTLQDTNISLAFWKSGAENHECTGCNGRDTVSMRKLSDDHWEATVGLDTTLVANGETGESQYWYHYVKTIPDYQIKEDSERFKSETNPDGLRELKHGWHKQSPMAKKDTVIAWNNIAPVNFDWVSTASDTINISQSNLTDTYELKWSESKDVDIDTIHYLVYAQIGVYPAEEIYDTTSTSVQITYKEFLENVFELFPILPGATVRFSVLATDGKDTLKVTGDNRVLFVNRYDYLSIAAEGVPLEFALHENYPNPFNPTTTLRFDLPEVSDITLTIYNMLGQKVRTFDYQNTSAGYHSVTWDATNDYGDPVGAGVYLYQLRADQFVKTRKMILLK
jgi:hypothetical protein